MVKRLLPAILSAVILLLGGCAEPPIVSEEQEEVIPVQTEQVKKEPFSEIVELSGRARSKQDFPVFAPTGMMIEQVYVQIGDDVRAGDPLLLLTQALGGGGAMGQAALKRAQALLDGAQTGAVTMLELETARQLLSQNESAAKEEPRFIFAPFDGVITLLNAQSGSMVSENIPVLQLSNLDQLVVDLQVGSSYIHQLQAGMKAYVWFDHLDKPVEASLDALSPGVSAEGNFYQAQINLSNVERTIFPGMLARVEVETQYYEDALLVPTESVFFQDEEAFVYKVQDGEAQLQTIKVNGRNPTHYRVLAGLKEGEQVVTLGRERLSDGRKVYVSNESDSR